MHPVHIPHELVNDETVLLVNWLIADGVEVKPGQALATIETSKTTMEVEASKAGYLRHGFPKQTEVAVGAVFCYIAAGPDEPMPVEAATSPVESRTNLVQLVTATPAQPAVSAVQGQSPPAAETTPPPAGTRFSTKAEALIRQHGLAAESFRGKGLIRERDVQQVLGISPRGGDKEPDSAARANADAALAKPAAPVATVPVRIVPLPRMKRTEAAYLAAAQHNTLPSLVSVVCPTSVTKSSGRMALILYETARLLRKYPIFNAFHHDGCAHYYEQVNLGFAVDEDHGLKVLVVPSADKKSINDIRKEVDDLILDYFNDALRPEALAGGTFTVTDLSGDDAFLFYPLINRNQAAILGVGASYFPPGSHQGVFNLMLAFDHQLAEGRVALRFLRELRERIRSCELALRSSSAEPDVELECARCLRSTSELADLGAPLLQEVRPNGERTIICRLCLEGW
jgi:pyruvate dehydrogenase E2 component (dihydrolipoamide acetyltransferase)